MPKLYTGMSPDAQFAKLRSEGYIGTIDDMIFAKLEDSGYTGAMTDKLASFFTQGGDQGTSPQPTRDSLLDSFTINEIGFPSQAATYDSSLGEGTVYRTTWRDVSSLRLEADPSKEYFFHIQSTDTEFRVLVREKPSGPVLLDIHPGEIKEGTFTGLSEYYVAPGQDGRVSFRLLEVSTERTPDA